MIVKLKTKNIDYPDLTAEQSYFVIGIEADDYRILNDFGKPYLYPPDLFDTIESSEPSAWVTEYGDEGERYSYPPVLNEVGFFEDYFEGQDEAVSRFWHVINGQLSEFSKRVDSLLREERVKNLLEIAAKIVQAQASAEPMSTEQIERSLTDAFSTLQKICREGDALSLKRPVSAKSLSRARIIAAKKRELPESLVKHLQERLQKKTVTAPASAYAAEQKTGKPAVKSRPRTRRAAGESKK